MWSWLDKGELILPLFFIGLGAIWVFDGSAMPIWDGFAPDSGFLPVIYGLLLILLAAGFLYELFAGHYEPIEQESPRKPLLILALLTATVIGIDIIGFAASMFLMLLALFAAIERRSLLASFAVAAGVTIALVVIFKTWLGVPLPLGPMGV